METLIIIILILVFYFLPMFIAISRGSANKGGVAFLNFFLGWTLIGWIICFIWAFGKTQKEIDLQNEFYKNNTKK